MLLASTLAKSYLIRMIGQLYFEIRQKQFYTPLESERLPATSRVAKYSGNTTSIKSSLLGYYMILYLKHSSKNRASSPKTCKATFGCDYNKCITTLLLYQRGALYFYSFTFTLGSPETSHGIILSYSVLPE